MKLVSYRGTHTRIGIVIAGRIFDLQALSADIPDDMVDFLHMGDRGMAIARQLEQTIKEYPDRFSPVDTPIPPAPVPHPSSFRDGYAFRQHVATARRNRGLEMIREFDQFPVFYFGNHRTICGPGEVHLMPDHFRQLDFELEVAVVIGKPGKNIPAHEADGHIAGYMILNDLSARTLQMEEMMLSLGPAKGKDFATVIGPYLVTPDELEPFRVPTRHGHTGDQFDLEMFCSVNGEQVSAGTMKDMDWTFAEIIERCSYGVELHAGDVIGSGTVGTGCFLELNGTGKLINPDYVPKWLREGDEVVLEVGGLGTLKTIIRAESSDWSILNRKK